LQPRLFCANARISERKKNKIDKIHPVLMTGNYYNDPRIADFASFIGSTAWNILTEQGYAMDQYVMSFTEMWTQEHYKQSSMDQHTHGNGAQIVGFYFLEVPENSSRVVFHDPRIAKTMIDLPQRNMNDATLASQAINFEPNPGMLMFANSWLAHSFTRHGSSKPIKFVHFNLMAQYTAPINSCVPPPAEII
jgi:uncharacterized protein (TIGR02466 family)